MCPCVLPRSGCATSEDMLWKLDALQSFIRELHWPEEVFAEHLDHRLKLMAADMIEAAAKRSVSAAPRAAHSPLSLAKLQRFD